MLVCYFLFLLYFQAAQLVLIDLFNLNAPELSMMLTNLPKPFQDSATKILQTHMRSASRDSDVLSPKNVTPQQNRSRPPSRSETCQGQAMVFCVVISLCTHVIDKFSEKTPNTIFYVNFTQIKQKFGNIIFFFKKIITTKIINYLSYKINLKKPNYSKLTRIHRIINL